LLVGYYAVTKSICRSEVAVVITRRNLVAENDPTYDRYRPKKQSWLA
jgi:hypothetical protein